MARRKILLVDDVRLILELEKSFLKYTPAQILTAQNGEEALEVARRELPDLIYMDMNMPKMDGLTCCAQIKQDPSLRHIPVIMVTTAGRVEDEILCREAGCDEYLTKPIDRRIFLHKGRQLLPEIDRREQRIPYEAKVTFDTGHQFGIGRSVDISPGGMFLATEMAIAEGSELALCITLPEADLLPLEAKGRVVWGNFSGARSKPQLPPGFGIEFIEIGEEAKATIVSLLGRDSAR